MSFFARQNQFKDKYNNGRCIDHQSMLRDRSSMTTLSRWPDSSSDDLQLFLHEIFITAALGLWCIYLADWNWRFISKFQSQTTSGVPFKAKTWSLLICLKFQHLIMLANCVILKVLRLALKVSKDQFCLGISSHLGLNLPNLPISVQDIDEEQLVWYPPTKLWRSPILMNVTVGTNPIKTHRPQAY